MTKILKDCGLHEKCKIPGRNSKPPFRKALSCGKLTRARHAKLRSALHNFIAQFTAFVHFLVFCLIFPTGASAQVAPDVYVPEDGITTDILPDFDALTANIPDVSETETGVPLVNITNPVDGVSINEYSRLIIGEDGVIFNNSLVPGISFLGGSVEANPNLTTPANIILNQVSSSEMSLIAGAVEVFGQSADVIFANPNGMTVNGAEFINTNTATFVTGLVALDSGQVIFDVTNGALVIGIDGVSGSNGLNLVGRTVSLQGLAEASDQITISGGAQRFNYMDGTAHSIAGQGGAPSFAVDGTHYGAARAGDITVLGNEAGLGVRLPGSLQATSGDLSIMSLDDIDFGALEAEGSIDILASGDVRQRRDAAAGDAFSVVAGGSYQADVDAGVFSGSDVSITAEENVGLAGELQAVGNLTIAAGENFTSETEISVGADVAIEAGVDAHVAAGIISAQNVEINAGDHAEVSDSYLVATDRVEVSGTDVTAGENSAYLGGDGVAFTADRTFTNETVIVDELSFEITFGENFINTATAQYVYDEIDLDVLGDFVNAGLFYGRDSVAVSGSEIFNDIGGTLAGGSVNLQADVDLSNFGLISSDAGLVINIGDGVIGGSFYNDGRVQGVAVDVTAEGLVNDVNGIILAHGSDLTLASSGDLLNDGILQSLGATDVTVSQAFINGGILAVGEFDPDTQAPAGDLNVSAADIVNLVGGAIYAGDADFVASRDFDNAGSILLNSGLELNVGNVFRQTGFAQIRGAAAITALDILTGQDSRFYSLGDLNLTATGDVILDGQTIVGGDIITQTETAILRGEISAYGAAAFTAVNLIADTESLLQASVIILEIDEIAALSGTIESAGQVNISAQTLIAAGSARSSTSILANAETVELLSNALWVAGDFISLSAQGLLQNQGSIVASGLVSLDGDVIGNSGFVQAGSLDEAGGLLPDGTIYLTGRQIGNAPSGVVSAGGISILAGELLNNAGMIVGGDYLDVDTDVLDNSGDLGSQNELTVLATSGQNAGQIFARDAVIDLDQTFLNLGRLTGADYLDVFADTLTNNGAILSNGSAYIEAADLLNGSDGVVQASFLDVSVANPFVNDGVVMGIYALNLLTPSIDNRGAIIAGVQGVVTDLDLSLESLTNTGLLQATGGLVLDVEDFVSTAGVIQAGGPLAIETGALSVLTNGAIRSQADAYINVSGLLSLGAGVVDENGETNGGAITAATLSVLADQIDAEANSVISAALSVDVVTEGSASIGGLLSAQTTTLIADSLNVGSEGSIEGYDVIVNIDSLLESQGSFNGNTLSLNAGQYIGGETSDVYAQTSIALTAMTIDNAGLFYVLAAETDNGLITLTADSITNSGDIIASSAAGLSEIVIMSDVDVINSGVFQASGDLTLETGALVNTGLIISESLLDVMADNYTDGLDSLLYSVGGTDMQIANEASVYGSVASEGDILINADTLWVGFGGSVATSENLTIETAFTGLETGFSQDVVEGETVITRAVIQGGNINLDSDSFEIGSGALVSALSNLNVALSQDSEIASALASGGDFTLFIDGGDLALTETGALQAASLLQLTADNVSNQGLISGSQIELLTGDLINTIAAGATADTSGLLVADTAMTLLLSGGLSNSGTIAVQDSAGTGAAFLLVSTPDVTNLAGGQIYSAGSLTLAGTNIMTAGGALDVQALSDLIRNDAAISIDVNDTTNLNNAGVISSGGNLVLLTNALETSGGLQSGGDIDVLVNADFSNEGLIISAGTGTYVLLGAGVNAGDIVAGQSAVPAIDDQAAIAEIASSLTLSSQNQNLLIQQNGRLAAIGDLDVYLGVGSLELADGDGIAGTDIIGGTLSGRNVVIFANALDVGAESTVAANSALIIQIAADLTNGGAIVSQGNGSIDAAALENESGAAIQFSGTGTLDFDGSLTNAGQIIGNSLDIAAASLANDAGGLVAVALDESGLSGALNVNLSSGLTNQGGFVNEGGAITVIAESLVQEASAFMIAGSQIEAGSTVAADLTIQVAQDVLNRGLLQSTRGVAVNAQNYSDVQAIVAGQVTQVENSQGVFVDARGAIVAGSDLDLLLSGDAEITGQVAAGGDLNLAATSLTIGGAGALAASGAAEIALTNDLVMQSLIDGNGALILGEDDNPSGAIIQAGNIILSASGLDMETGSVIYGAAADGSVSSIGLSGSAPHSIWGQIITAHDLTFEAESIDIGPTGGLRSGGNFNLVVSTDLVISGLVAAGDDLAVTALSLVTTETGTLAGDTVAVNLDGDFTHSGRILAVEPTDEVTLVTGNDLNNAIVLTIGGAMTQNGTIAGDSIDISSTDFTAGAGSFLQASFGDIDIALGTGAFENLGTIYANGDLTVTAGTINIMQTGVGADSVRGVMAGNNVELTSSDSFDNAGAISGVDIELTGTSYEGTETSVVQAIGGDLVISVANDISNAGTLAAAMDAGGQGGLVSLSANNITHGVLGNDINESAVLSAAFVEITATGTATNYGRIFASEPLGAGDVAVNLNSNTVTVSSGDGIYNHGYIVGDAVTLVGPRYEGFEASYVQAAAGDITYNEAAGTFYNAGTMSAARFEGEATGGLVSLAANEIFNGLLAAGSGQTVDTATITGVNISAASATDLENGGRLIALEGSETGTDANGDDFEFTPNHVSNDISLSASGTVLNSGLILSDNILVDAASFENVIAGLISASAGNLVIDTGANGTIYNAGTLAASFYIPPSGDLTAIDLETGQVVLIAASVDNQAYDDVANEGGFITATGNVLFAQDGVQTSLFENLGRVNAGGLSFAGDEFVNIGLVDLAGSLDVSADLFDNTGVINAAYVTLAFTDPAYNLGTLNAAQLLDISYGGTLSVDSDLTSGGLTVLNVGGLHIEAGGTVSSVSILINADGFEETYGSAGELTSVTYGAGDALIEGTIEAIANGECQICDLSNIAEGLVAVTGFNHVDVSGGAINSAGSPDGYVSLTAAALSNSGTIESSGSVFIDLAGNGVPDLVNIGGTNIPLAGTDPTLANLSYAVGAPVISSAFQSGALAINAGDSGMLVNAGTIVAGADIVLDADAVSNSQAAGISAGGLLYAEIRDDLDTVSRGLSGAIISANIDQVYGSDLDGFDATEALYLTLRGGGYSFDDALSLTADTVIQTSGHIAVNADITAAGDITLISGGDYYQADGIVNSAGDIFFQALGFIYNNSTIESTGGDITLIAAQLFNVRGAGGTSGPAGGGNTGGGNTGGGGGNTGGGGGGGGSFDDGQNQAANKADSVTGQMLETGPLIETADYVAVTAIGVNVPGGQKVIERQASQSSNNEADTIGEGGGGGGLPGGGTGGSTDDTGGSTDDTGGAADGGTAGDDTTDDNAAGDGTTGDGTTGGDTSGGDTTAPPDVPVIPVIPTDPSDPIVIPVIDQGVIRAIGDVTIVTSDLINDAADIIAVQDILIFGPETGGGNVYNAAGTIQALADVIISIEGDLVNTGLLEAGGALNISAANVFNGTSAASPFGVAPLSIGFEGLDISNVLGDLGIDPAEFVAVEIEGPEIVAIDPSLFAGELDFDFDLFGFDGLAFEADLSLGGSPGFSQQLAATSDFATPNFQDTSSPAGLFGVDFAPVGTAVTNSTPDVPTSQQGLGALAGLLDGDLNFAAITPDALPGALPLNIDAPQPGSAPVIPIMDGFDDAVGATDPDLATDDLGVDGIAVPDPDDINGANQILDGTTEFLAFIDGLTSLDDLGQPVAITPEAPGLSAAIGELTDAELAEVLNIEFDNALEEALDEEQRRREYETYVQDGVNLANYLGLGQGERPTDAQLAMLDSPIILMVTNGNGDLVPEIFMPEGDGLDTVRSAPGAMIGSDVYITATGDVVNYGGVAAQAQLLIDAAGSISNFGGGVNEARGLYQTAAGTLSGGVVSLDAGLDLLNRGGNILGANYLSLTAGNDIINQAVNTSFILTEADGCRGKACGRSVRDFAMAQISSGGELYMDAGNDILNTASYIGGYDAVTLIAGNDIINEALTTKFVLRDYKKKKLFGKKVDYAEDAIIASGVVQSFADDVILSAGRDINIVGSQVHALSEGSLTYAQAGRDILLDAVEIELKFKKKKSGLFTGGSLYSNNSKKWNDYNVALAEVTGFDVELDAGRDITSNSGQLYAQNNLVLSAGRDIISNATTLEKYYEEKTFAIGVSFPGSDLLTAAIEGDLDAVGQAFLRSNPFASSVMNLANSETGFEAAANAANALGQGTALGRRVTDSIQAEARRNSSNATRNIIGDGVGNQMVDELNPFSSFNRGTATTSYFTDSDGNFTDSTGKRLAEGQPGIVDPSRSSSGARNFLSNFTFSLSGSTTRNDWTESIASSFSAGNDVTMTAGRDILLRGGTQVTAGRNASFNAARDILLEAAENTSRSRSNSWGANFGLNPEGFTVGVNGSNQNSDGTTYDYAGVTAGAQASFNAGRDMTLMGARVDAADIAVNVARDLHIETLQNTSTSDGSNFGMSVTFTGSVPTNGSLSLGASEANRAWADTLSGLFASGSNDIFVGGETSLIGAVLAAADGELNLDTGSLRTEDLFDTDTSSSWGISVAGGTGLGDGSASLSSIGGHYSTATRESETNTTITSGNVTVRDLSEAETEALLASINREVDNAQVVTTDTSFDTGQISLDVQSILEIDDNLREINRVRNIISDENLPRDVDPANEIEVDFFRRMRLAGKKDAEILDLMNTSEYIQFENDTRIWQQAIGQWGSARNVPPSVRDQIAAGNGHELQLNADGELIVPGDCGTGTASGNPGCSYRFGEVNDGLVTVDAAAIISDAARKFAITLDSLDIVEAELEAAEAERRRLYNFCSGASVNCTSVQSPEYYAAESEVRRLKTEKNQHELELQRVANYVALCGDFEEFVNDEAGHNARLSELLGIDTEGETRQRRRLFNNITENAVEYGDSGQQLANNILQGDDGQAAFVDAVAANQTLREREQELAPRPEYARNEALYANSATGAYLDSAIEFNLARQRRMGERGGWLTRITGGGLQNDEYIAAARELNGAAAVLLASLSGDQGIVVSEAYGGRIAGNLGPHVDGIIDLMPGGRLVPESLVGSYEDATVGLNTEDSANSPSVTLGWGSLGTANVGDGEVASALSLFDSTIDDAIGVQGNDSVLLADSRRNHTSNTITFNLGIEAGATVLTGGAYVAVGSIRRTVQAARMARAFNRAVDATDLSTDVNTIIRMGGSHADNYADTAARNNLTTRDRANQGPYNPREMRNLMDERFGADNVTSTTIPGSPLMRANDADGLRVINGPDGGRAVEVDYKDPITGQDTTANIPYNGRGLPVLDDVAVYTTTIQRSPSSSTEMERATRELRDLIANDRYAGPRFNAEQMDAINRGAQTIPGFRWHHNGDVNNFQLLPQDVHDVISHIGERSLRGGK